MLLAPTSPHPAAASASGLGLDEPELVALLSAIDNDLEFASPEKRRLLAPGRNALLAELRAVRFG